MSVSDTKLGIAVAWRVARSTVPVMAELSGRHPRLNPVNLEAAATGLVLDATMLLSTEAARGALSEILDAEDIRWGTVEID